MAITKPLLQFFTSSRNPPPPPPLPSPPSPPPSPRRQPVPPPPSTSFFCPISTLLMSNPIIVPSGHTFDLPCIRACKHLNYSSPLLNLNQDSPIIPNINLRAAIRDYCRRYGYPLPTPISFDSALYFVRNLIFTHKSQPFPPPPLLPLPPFSYDPTTEKNILANLQEHSHHAAQELTLFSLIQTPYCSPRILAAVIPLISSPNQTLESLAARVISILSATPINRAHILRCGAVPPLITLLYTDRPSACEPAIRALYALSVEETNRIPIAALGAIQPLLEHLSGFFLPAKARAEAGMALNHLSSCRLNLETILNDGAVRKLINTLEVTSTVGVKMQLLGLIEIAMSIEGAATEFMARGGVKLLVKLVKEKEGVGLCSMRVMQSLCNGNNLEKFRALAKEARGVEALMVEREDWVEYEMGIARDLVSALTLESSSGGDKAN